MKIIAFYLPQFHRIPENDKWWGEGFTEWVNVKKGKKIVEGQRQPRVPLDHYYYDLTDPKVMRWQAELARKYGVFGFCFYHYWYSGKMLLETPVNNFLKDKSININFCISWANHSWTNSWVSSNTRTLIEQTYGDKNEWQEHYNYLVKFFKDKRYITIDNKPLLVIYAPEDIPNLKELLNFWNLRAKEDGFEGISYAYQGAGLDINKSSKSLLFDYNIEYQPNYAFAFKAQERFTFLRKLNRKIKKYLKNYLNISYRTDALLGFQKKNYDDVWRTILDMPPVNKKSIPGAFVDWDNTSRKGNRGSVCVNSSPKKFENYLSQQIRRAKDVYKKDFIFMFAWNEWAECGYLEPDEENKYGNLEAIKNALMMNNEFPKF